jgi:hypothetical protein
MLAYRLGNPDRARDRMDDSADSPERTIGRLTTLVGLALVLAGCRAEVVGPPAPPAEFGDHDRPLFGCPELEGVYRWPPVAGEYAGGAMASNREPWAGGTPVPVGRGEMQIWVSDDDGLVSVRSRRINRAANVHDRLAREWSYVEYAAGEYRCADGMLQVEPMEIPAEEDYGGTGLRRGFRLARLADGALAVDIETVAFGRTESLFTWADSSAGTIALPDKTFHAWSKLERMGPGDVEPAPIDAGAAP